MNEQEMLEKLTEIGTCEDPATRRQMLTEVTDGIKGVFGNLNTVSEQKQTLEADNKKLQEYNMQLFLRVGSPTQPKQDPKKDPPANLTYENLFDENGGLK